MAADEPLRVTRCEGDAVEGCVKGERCCAHDLWSSLGAPNDVFPRVDHAGRCGVKSATWRWRLPSSRPKIAMCRGWRGENLSRP